MNQEVVVIVIFMLVQSCFLVFRMDFRATKSWDKKHK